MKLLVTTRADDSIDIMSEKTHPVIKKYAEKCGADFSILKSF